MSLRPSMLPKLAVCACYEPNLDAGPQAARGTKLDEIFRRRIHGDRSDDGSTLAEDLSAVDWAIHTLKAIAGESRIVTADADCKIATQGYTPSELHLPLRKRAYQSCGHAEARSNQAPPYHP
jgi:hypothetical protein